MEILVLAIAGVVVYYLYQDSQRRRKEEYIRREVERVNEEDERNHRAGDEVMARMRRVVAEHKDTLLRKRRQTQLRDDYGLAVDDAWRRETKYFFDRLLRPLLPAHWEWWDDNFTHDFIEEELGADVTTSEDVSQSVWDGTGSPLEFEAFCAGLLTASGWDAHLTQVSGDQGIDIMASRDGLKAVFQCKLSSSPVGNKAVQEAIAGRVYADADQAYVVSNASFTQSARELASASRVGLLHYSQLSALKG